MSRLGIISIIAIISTCLPLLSSGRNIMAVIGSSFFISTREEDAGLPELDSVPVQCSAKWFFFKAAIERRIDSFRKESNKLKNKINKGNGNIGLYKKQRQFLIKRINELRPLPALMDSLGGSKTKFAVFNADSVGFTSYDIVNHWIKLSVIDTASFVHEFVHAWQYERGGLAYDEIKDTAYLGDLYDEVDAYRAQFAYDTSSIRTLAPNDTADSFDKITTGWISRIEKYGQRIYRYFSADHLNLDTQCKLLLEFYPWLKDRITAGKCRTIKDIGNIRYKGVENTKVSRLDPFLVD